MPDRFKAPRRGADMSRPEWRVGLGNVDDVHFLYAICPANPSSPSMPHLTDTVRDWRVTHLSEVADLRTEKVVPSDGDTRPYIALEHLAQGRPTVLGPSLGWASAGTTTSAKTLFRKGDVLFGKLRPNLRKAAAAAIRRPVFDRHLAAVRWGRRGLGVSASAFAMASFAAARGRHGVGNEDAENIVKTIGRVHVFRFRPSPRSARLPPSSLRWTPASREPRRSSTRYRSSSAV